MFFSWRNKNKHFQQRKRLGGQIFPFLLIGLVALLAIALSIPGIFGGVKTRTCAENGADAGSLAIGSRLAGAFNDLALRNKEMSNYFDQYLGYYTILKTASESYSGEAETFSKKVEELLNNAIDKTYKGDCKAPWTHIKDAGNILSNTTDFYNSAAGQALEAAESIGAFKILTLYMNFLTDNFKAHQQYWHYRDAWIAMDSSFKTAQTTGFSYAFNNSCSTGDGFSFYVRTMEYIPSTEPVRTYPPDTFEDGCSVTVKLKIPRIDHYDLMHTIWNYPIKKTLTYAGISCTYKDGIGLTWPSWTESNDPFNTLGSNQLEWIYNAISIALDNAAANALIIYNYTVNFHEDEGSDPCPTPEDPGKMCPWKRCHSYPTELKAANDSVDLFKPYLVCIRDALNTLNKQVDGVLSILTLRKLNSEIYEKVWAPVWGSFFPSSGIEGNMGQDAAVYVDDSGYPGLMIVKIDEVYLSPAEWANWCMVDKWCKTTDKKTGIPTYTRCQAHSKATFRGQGVLRTFADLFETELTVAALGPI